MRSSRRRRGPSLFGGLSATAFAGALVLAFSPAHAPSPGHSHLQAHAAQLAPAVATAIASPVVAAAPVAAPAEVRHDPAPPPWLAQEVLWNIPISPCPTPDAPRLLCVTPSPP
jgi:hypothetical protein